MSQETKLNLKLGPFKWTFRGVPVGLTVVLAIVFWAISIALVIAAFVVIAHNVVLIGQTSTWDGWNVVYVTLAAFYLTAIASGSSNE